MAQKKCADCKYLLKSQKCKLRLGTISENIPQNPAFNFGNECFRTRNWTPVA
jgi:hypothetical protein